MTNESASIGLQRIWKEGEGVERVSFLGRIAHVVRRAFENLRRSRMTTSLTVITIAVALAVLSFFALLIHNGSLAARREGGEVMVMVFLKDAATDSDVENLESQLKDLTDGLEVTYTDKTEALASFRSMLGEDSVILEGVETQNPLPASINVTIPDAERAEELYAAISSRLGSDGLVDSIRYSKSGVQQLKRLIRVVEVGGSLGMVLLLVITGFIIANTIKLALYNHRMEIEIMEFVGARRGAIYAPYLLEGLGQGILGAMLGIGVVFALHLLIAQSVSQSEVLRMVFPTFEFLSVSVLGYIVLAGALVGVGGSFLAVRRFVAEE